LNPELPGAECAHVYETVVADFKAKLAALQLAREHRLLQKVR
jgi:hypothetical protein